MREPFDPIAIGSAQGKRVNYYMEAYFRRLCVNKINARLAKRSCSEFKCFV